jgi:hypothetical protein
MAHQDEDIDAYYEVYEDENFATPKPASVSSLEYNPDVPCDSIEPVATPDRLSQPTPSKPDFYSEEAEVAEGGEENADSGSESLDEEPIQINERKWLRSVLVTSLLILLQRSTVVRGR